MRRLLMTSKAGFVLLHLFHDSSPCVFWSPRPGSNGHALWALAFETSASANSATRGRMRLGVAGRIRTGDARVTTLSLRPLGDGHTQTHIASDSSGAASGSRSRLPPVRQTGALPTELWRHVSLLVRAAGLEPATACSQSRCATNCATHGSCSLWLSVTGSDAAQSLRPVCACRSASSTTGFWSGIPCGSRTRLFGLKGRGPHRKSNGTEMKTGTS